MASGSTATQIVLEELPDAPTKGMRSNLPLLSTGSRRSATPRRTSPS